MKEAATDQGVVGIGGPLQPADSLSSRAYQRLRTAIVSGMLSAGLPLSENLFTRELQISRSSLREALIRLETEGYVCRGAGGRWSVRKLDRESAAEMYGCRAALEGFAAHLVAQRVKPKELATLKAHLAAARDAFASGDIELTAKQTTAFHDDIVLLAGNRKLSELMDQLRSQLVELRVLMLTRSTRGDDFLADNEAVVAAIESGDPTAAEQAARVSVNKDSQAVGRLFDRGII